MAKGKFKSFVKSTGEVLTAMAENQREVKELANKLVNKTYGVDYEQAEKIARVLIAQAEVTWK